MDNKLFDDNIYTNNILIKIFSENCIIISLPEKSVQLNYEKIESILDKIESSLSNEDIHFMSNGKSIFILDDTPFHKICNIIIERIFNEQF